MTARCASATNLVAPGTASVIPPRVTHPPRSGRVLTLKGHSINQLAYGRAVGFSVSGLADLGRPEIRSPRRGNGGRGYGS